ncbi:MAG: hypothetical protein LDL31_07775 [Prosthecobacter sp.]|nr:hypothetical protein [Prosthecobacter sp.]
MSISLQIDVSGDEQVIKLLGRLRGALTDTTELHKSIGSYAETLTRQHLTTLAQTRHDTADRLGAKRSGHLARAAEGVSSRGTQEAAFVKVVSPGIARAFGDITITPKNGSKYLTIPATAEAYNRRARTFNDLRVAFFGRGRLALVKAEQSSLSDRKASGGRSEVYYWLKKTVTQKQDRSLLPPDDDFAAAAQGIKAYIRLLRAAAAFDERLRAVVSSCGFTPFQDYYGGKVAGWTSDRYMPRIRDVYGNAPDKIPFDFHEILAALAPRGFFSNSPAGDGNFDLGGVRKAFAAAREVHALFGEPRLVLRTPDCGHDFPEPERLAAYEWLDAVLK